ncbi:hypothetical protein A9Q83_11185 [Alphaproteobacteria bacterium 46_93_T64]|nr:hypothetical protein A9Q83_11185 [Alphaproteobacteria bacterium 46_93_T64]
MENPTEHLPQNLKCLRDRKAWSLSKAACETGVSKAMLGQIERGESSPTIATLWKIATGFDTSLSYLMERRATDEERKSVLSKDANLIRRAIAEDGMLVAALQTYDPDLGFDFLELTFPDGYERHSEAHKTGVTEFVVVLDGEMEVQTEGEWYKLRKGQSLRFHGDLGHAYRNNSGAAATVHCVIHYPKEQD